MDEVERLQTESRSMLYGAPARAVLRVEDYQRAKAFYHDILGLPVDDVTGESGIVLAGDGTQIELYRQPRFPAPHNTVVAFHATDFDATVADLRRRGVTFEEYDSPDLKTENGVAEIGGAKRAWFKDSEGNVLSVVTM